MKWRERFDIQPPRYRTETSYSFGVQSPALVFGSLGLGAGKCLLDAGCGPGEYSFPAAEHVGETGTVIALDRDLRMIEQLRHKAKCSGVKNITSLHADLGEPLPLPDQSVDAVLISGVLHMPGLDDRWGVLFPELYRALRPDGRLGIIESSRISASPDLPLHLRLTSHTITAEIKRYGFQPCGLVELAGTALVLFEKAGS
jgi:ubiquinone/menaquinone biosynthesis C-methylase UbiE